LPLRTSCLCTPPTTPTESRPVIIKGEFFDISPKNPSALDLGVRDEYDVSEGENAAEFQKWGCGEIEVVAEECSVGYRGLE